MLLEAGLMAIYVGDYRRGSSRSAVARRSFPAATDSDRFIVAAA